jgi:hypothetical protein
MFDYDIEYLESQMRGADFERYMTRLDEEISIGLFTPILLLRTADVGSYNLGVGHMQMYLWMLNAMNDDRAQYINKYLLRKMTNFNFSEKAPSPKIVYRKMGNTDSSMIKDLMLAVINSGKAKVDLDELGTMAGMKLTEIKQTTQQDPNADPNADPNGPGADPNQQTESGDVKPPPAAITSSQPYASDVFAVVTEIENRVRPQVESAFRNGTWNADLQINMGYKRKMEKAVASMGMAYPIVSTNELYGRMDNWLNDIVAVDLAGPEQFMGLFSSVLRFEIGNLLDAA